MPESPVTDSLWDRVEPHAWKWTIRTRKIDGIVCHFTGSGQPYDAAKEYRATVNWFVSPGNKVSQDGAVFAGISSYLVGPENITEVMPDGYVPRFSSASSDFHAVSIEFARAGRVAPWDPRVIANGAKLIRWLWAAYPAIEHRRVTRDVLTSDSYWSGLLGHEDTYQGRAQGKSDPGADFWPLMLAALEQEEDMPDPRLDAVVAALGGMDEIERWNARGNSLLLGYANEQKRTGELEGVLSAHLASPHGAISPEQFARAIELGAKATADSIKFAGQKANGG